MGITDHLPSIQADQPPPPRLASFVEIGQWRADRHGNQPAYTFLRPGRNEAETISYELLDQRVRAVAAALMASGQRGQRVLIVQQPGLEYIVSLYACMYAGMVAVPVYPLDGFRLQHTLPRLQAITRDAAATILLTSQEALLAGSSPDDDRVIGPLGDLCKQAVLRSDRIDQGLAKTYKNQPPDRNGLAILQYTSGTTGQPRGVALQHRHLLANAQQIYGAYHVPDAVCVFWLPPYHDMGLVGGLLLPMFAGRRSVLMSPTSFVQQPAAWLQAISDYRGTTTASPNFGYELCLRKISDEARESLDLSSLRVAISGAEPIRAATLDRFAKQFAPCGLQSSALTPAYGMAEATLAITGKPLNEEPVAVDFDAELLHENLAVAANDVSPPAAATPSGRSAETRRFSRLVSCGVPLSGAEVLIVDPETRRPLGDNQIGEIWVRSPAVADGYWQQPEWSQTTFAARLADAESRPKSRNRRSRLTKPDTFLQTGDLGFIHEEQLFVSGRLKDLIIIAGRNYFPHELEAVVQSAHEALKVDGGVAFSYLPDDVREGESERLVIVQEVLRPKRYPLHELAERVRTVLAEQFDLSPDAIALVPAGSLSKTSSGKMQRHECRRRYLKQELQPLWVWDRDSVQTSNLSTGIAPDPQSLRSSEIARALAPLWCEVLDLAHASDDQHFLDQGGHSLAAFELLSRIRDRLGVTLPWETLFRAPRFGQLVIELERLAEAASNVPAALHEPPVELIPTDGQPFPLTPAQQRFWLLDQLEWRQAFLHVEATLRIRGKVDRSRIAEIVRHLPQRHAALRLRLDVDSLGVPFQRVMNHCELEVQRVDLCGLAMLQQQEQLTNLRAEVVQPPFDLQQGRIARAAIVRLAHDETALIFAAHHLVCDGTSLLLLMEDIAQEYSRSLAGPENDSVEAHAGTPWAEAIGRQLQRRDHLVAGREYWTERLRDAPAQSPLAICPPVAVPGRTAAVRPPSRLHQLRLPSELAARLHQRGCDWQVTALEILLAAWHVVLRRCSDHRDLVLGVPVAGRDHPSLQRQIGCFINTLPVRLSGTEQETFAQFVRRVSESWRQDLAHAAVPLDEIIEAAALPRWIDQLPLIQHLVLHQPPLNQSLHFGEAHCHDWSSSYSTLGAYDTALICHPYRNDDQSGNQQHAAASDQSRVWQYELGIAYAPDRLDDVAAENLLAGLVEFLDQALVTPDRELSALSSRGPRERQRAETACRPRREHQLRETVLEMFARRVAQTPDQVVIHDTAGGMTFAQLDRASTELAHDLLRQGVRPGAFVALRLGRSRRIILSALAVWKAGAAYLPLDPNYPPQRIADILADAQPVCVIEEPIWSSEDRPLKIVSTEWAVDAESKSEPRRSVFASDQAKSADAPLLPGAALSGLAYLIYTSGSTGKPKGVMVGHDNLANLLLSFAVSPGLVAGQRILAATTMSFDISVLELFLPLVTGSTAVIAPQSLSEDPDSVLSWIAGHRVDVIQATPSSLRMLLAGGWSPHPDQTIWCGGEPLHLDLAKSITAAGAKLWNLYGPTETTVWSLACEITTPEQTPISIGHPIDSTTICIVDSQGQMVSEGMAGELWIGGQGVARGYWNRPELTSERFIEVAGQGRMYRTGDRVRRRTDGVLEFLGRVDRQVKIRGHRVELGEIEAVLNRCEAVAESAVACVVRSETDQRLVAFYRPLPDRSVMSDDLRAALQASLPAHMVPAMLVPLDQLPHTPAGKIDYQRLPDVDEWKSEPPSLETTDADRDGLSQTQRQVADIWREVLGVEAIGADDNFFQLGGHSLLAAQVFSRLRTRLGVQIPLREIYTHPTIAGLAQLIDNSLSQLAANETVAVEGAASNEADDSLAGFLAVQRDQPASADPQLSPAEQRLWFVDQLEPEHPFYNLPLAARIKGPLDHTLLCQSIQACVDRHETLRSTYHLVEGRPQRQVAERMNVQPTFIDVCNQGPTAEDLSKWLAEEARRPFDLSCGPLLRVVGWQLSAQDHLILLVMHHIISDGWSMGVMLRELSEFYRAGQQGVVPQLRPLPASYRDYAAWQNQLLSPERVEPTLAFWRQKLEGAVETLDLPVDFPRPLVQRFDGARLAVELSPELSKQVDTLASRLGVTPYAVFLASYSLLLSRLSRQHDVSIGTAVANRTDPLIEDLIGFFVNTVVIRQQLTGTETFEQWVQQTHVTATEAIDHQEVPFEQVVRHLAKHRDRSHSPLFQAAFILQNAPVPLEVSPGLALIPLDIDNGTAKYDLTLTLSQRASVYQGHFEYRTSLLRAQTAQRFRDAWLTLLSAAVEQSQTPIAELPLITPSARAEILARGTGPAMSSRRSQTLHGLVAEAAARHPAATAIRQSDRFVTYADLHIEVLRIAAGLKAEGIKGGDRVLVYLPRSIEQIASTLAVMHCGGAFCPVDPQVPLGRLQAIANDLKPAAVISDANVASAVRVSLHDLIPCFTPLQLGNADPGHQQTVAVAPSDLAYLIFTSGSTGKPKGVAIEHQAICNFVHGFAAALQLTPGLRSSHLFSPSFDGAIGEIFPVLASGGCLEVIDQDTALDPAALISVLNERRVQFLSATPATLAMLDPERLRSVRKVLSAGAVLSGELAARWMKTHCLYNGYGPTECTIGASFAKLDDSDLPVPSVGRPLSNVRLYVLDENAQLVPDGVIGEVFIGGAGVGRGYWQRAEPTAHAFLVDPFVSEELAGQPRPRMYRTGDLGRWNHAGRLEIVGRADEQIKLRGFRIEPGEIAFVLEQVPGVKQAAVILQKPKPADARGAESDASTSDQARLVAYVVPDPTNETLSDPLQQQVLSDEHDQVENWRLLFDQSHQPAPIGVDPADDFSGWTSVITGQPIPLHSMRRWADAAASRIAELQPKRMLEIGCGTGLMLLRLTEYFDQYTGIDLHQASLNQLAAVIDKRPSLKERVTLLQRTADQLDDLPSGGFDTIVLNSVVQYFPSEAYLIRVLQGAQRLLAPGGKIFLGDLRNLRLQEALAVAAELYRRGDLPSTAGQFRHRVRSRIAHDEELLVDPDLLPHLAPHLERLAGVQTRVKTADSDSELHRFRFDAVLSFDEFRDKDNGNPTSLYLYNSNVHREVVIARLLHEADFRADLDEVLRAAEAELQPASSPSALALVAAEAGLQIVIDWHPHASDGLRVSCQRNGIAIPAAQIAKQLSVVPIGDPVLDVRQTRRWASQPHARRHAIQLIERMRDELRQRLSAYMVPTAFVLVDDLPLTIQGKLDRSALPPPPSERLTSNAPLREAQTQTQRVLVEIWEELLDVSPIGIDDDFFDLGGHSMLAVRMVAQVRKRLGRSLPLAALFSKPTITQLAKVLEKPASTQSSALVPLTTSGSEQPLFCIHPAGGTVFCYQELAHCFVHQRPVFGLQARGVDGLERPDTTVQEMAHYYAAAIRSVVRQGPLHLVGWSLGGNIAFEVAQQLAQSGREVGLLALLDSGVLAAQDDWSEQDFLPLIAALFPGQQHVSLEALRQARPEEQLAYFIRQAANAGIVPEGPSETGTHIFDVFQANVKAVHDYQPQPYAGSLLLIRPTAQMRTSKLFDDQTLGWHTYSQRVELARVSGDHAHMLQPPAVVEIAAELNKRLSRYSSARRNRHRVLRS